MQPFPKFPLQVDPQLFSLKCFAFSEFSKFSQCSHILGVISGAIEDINRFAHCTFIHVLLGVVLRECVHWIVKLVECLQCLRKGSVFEVYENRLIELCDRYKFTS